MRKKDLFLYKSLYIFFLSKVIHFYYLEIIDIYITSIYNLKLMSCIFELYTKVKIVLKILVFTDRTELHYNLKVP